VKYVILYQQRDGYLKVYPIIFTEHLIHAVVAQSVIHGTMREEGMELKVLSAGFCEMGDDIDWECQTGSESLRIEKEKEWNGERGRVDANILNMPNAMQGIIYA